MLSSIFRFRARPQAILHDLQFVLDMMQLHIISVHHSLSWQRIPLLLVVPKTEDPKEYLRDHVNMGDEKEEGEEGDRGVSPEKSELIHRHGASWLHCTQSIRELHAFFQRKARMQDEAKLVEKPEDSLVRDRGVQLLDKDGGNYPQLPGMQEFLEHLDEDERDFRDYDHGDWFRYIKYWEPQEDVRVWSPADERQFQEVRAINISNFNRAGANMFNGFSLSWARLLELRNIQEARRARFWGDYADFMCGSRECIWFAAETFGKDFVPDAVLGQEFQTKYDLHLVKNNGKNPGYQVRANERRRLMERALLSDEDRNVGSEPQSEPDVWSGGIS
ncbi:unnamed protein product [Amoebophrya sp. A25]|nr:unnamed protein product [Amoebophrya sp. A25]|eukprot:GSA25T00015665001.1